MAVLVMNGRKSIAALDDALLYGILDMGYVAEAEMQRVAEALLAGGVGALQLRAKGYDEAGVLRLLQEVAPRIVEVCKTYEVPFIINDFPDVAVSVGADGVHIGQDDGSLAEVRAVVGEQMIVGRSTHSPDQARAAMSEGFDYIGFGPLFPTPTKQGRPGIGLENVSAIQQEVGSKIPMYCIGGIKTGNLDLVLASGARRVVIVSALLQAEYIEAATRGIVSSLNVKF